MYLQISELKLLRDPGKVPDKQRSAHNEPNSQGEVLKIGCCINYSIVKSHHGENRTPQRLTIDVVDGVLISVEAD